MRKQGHDSCSQVLTLPSPASSDTVCCRLSAVILRLLQLLRTQKRSNKAGGIGTVTPQFHPYPTGHSADTLNSFQGEKGLVRLRRN
jgi:hypothetical protein